MSDSKDDQNAAPARPKLPNSGIDPTKMRPVSNNAELNDELERLRKLRAESKQSTDELLSCASTPKQSTNESPSSVSTPKSSGNKNALRHGVYFHGLLPWESPEEFEALHKSLREDWKCDGALQEEAVLVLCQWMWKRRRVLQGSQVSYFRSPVVESLKNGEVSWDDVVQYQAKVPEQINELISSQIKLIENLNSVSDRIGEHYYWTNTTEGKDIQLQLAKMRSDVGSLASKVREHTLDEKNNLKTAVEKITNLFDHAYQPDEIEKQVQLLSMIDREIDKTIKRLIFLKTFKSVEAADEARKVGARAAPSLASPPVIPNEDPSVEASPGQSNPLRGTPTRPVALAAPEHRGKPKADE